MLSIQRISRAYVSHMAHVAGHRVTVTSIGIFCGHRFWWPSSFSSPAVLCVEQMMVTVAATNDMTQQKSDPNNKKATRQINEEGAENDAR